MQGGSVAFGVSAKLCQRLAGSCAPERELTVVTGRRDVHHYLGQRAVVGHPQIYATWPPASRRGRLGERYHRGEPEGPSGRTRLR
jgi:hypothetical protein